MLLTFLQENLIYFVIIFFVLIISLYAYIIFIHKKILNFTKGSKAESFEDIIKEILKSANEIKKSNEDIENHACSLDTKIENSIRNIQTLRYKAFDTNGSNQSFSTALLNEKGNGVIITSLHHHDSVRTFAKPIEKYKSIYDLTDEEKEVLEKSKKEHKDIR